MASAAAGTAACTVTPAELAEMTAQGQSLPEFTWQMATSFPPIADIIVDMSVTFAEHVAAMTNGKFRIEPRLAGELAPPLEVMNVVEQGAVQCGLTTSYYFIGKSPVNAFGTSLPFGLTARQNNAWFYEGDGLALLREFYAERFGIIQFPGGTSGAQMGGWFNRAVRSLDDIVGLKMRIPGLGGQVFDQLGATVQVLLVWVIPRLHTNACTKGMVHAGRTSIGAMPSISARLHWRRRLPSRSVGRMFPSTTPCGKTWWSRYQAATWFSWERARWLSIRLSGATGPWGGCSSRVPMTYSPAQGK